MYPQSAELSFVKSQFVLGPVVGSRADATSIKSVKVQHPTLVLLHSSACMLCFRDRPLLPEQLIWCPWLKGLGLSRLLHHRDTITKP